MMETWWTMDILYFKVSLRWLSSLLRDSFGLLRCTSTCLPEDIQSFNSRRTSVAFLLSWKLPPHNITEQQQQQQPMFVGLAFDYAPTEFVFL